jgi:hypothetical protein
MTARNNAIPNDKAIAAVPIAIPTTAASTRRTIELLGFSKTISRQETRTGPITVSRITVLISPVEGPGIVWEAMITK